MRARPRPCRVDPSLEPAAHEIGSQRLCTVRSLVHVWLTSRMREGGAAPLAALASAGAYAPFRVALHGYAGGVDFAALTIYLFIRDQI
eukprot:5009804-Pyramimonas_sp.AAC.1